MEEKIDVAIENVLGRIRANVTNDEALKYTQAVLNLMHAKNVWIELQKLPRKPAKDS